MQPGTYNFGVHVTGDTIPTKRFTITEGVAPDPVTPVDLTGAAIAIDFVFKKNRIHKEIGSGITVIDAANGIFDLDAFTLSVDGLWSYDLQVTLADASVNTWLAGNIKMIKDITP